MLNTSVANHKIHQILVASLGTAIIVSLFMFCAPSMAQSILDECEIGEFDAGDALLTRSEKIALMEKHFQDSLTAFAECMGRQSSAAGGGGGSGGGGGAGVGTSEAVAGIEGTESDQTTPSVASVSAQTEQLSGDLEFTPEPTEFTPELTDQSQADSSATRPVPPVDLNSGKMPEDIQQYDNDSVLEAQIKRAAMNEEDPALRERLWDQYRAYKAGN